jgi:hypothetical protein
MNKPPFQGLARARDSAKWGTTKVRAGRGCKWAEGMVTAEKSINRLGDGIREFHSTL